MMVMTNLLLYTHTESIWLIALEWGVAILFLLFLFVSLFVQRRMGKRLKAELEQLDKIRKGNVEYDFILKAMKIAVWRYDAESHSLLFEKDYRDGRNNYVPAINENFQETLAVVAPADVDHVNRAFEDICEGRTDFYHQEYQVLDKASGINYWEESYATIVDRDSEGKPTKIVGTSQRIDERKELMASLVAARNKAEESDRLKTAFLANMGHEIRTPLNAIVGFADLLPVVESEADRNQLIQEIQNNNHKLLKIIDGLVSMSKIEAEAKNLVMSQTDIVPLLKGIADTHAQLVDGTSLIIATHFPYAELYMYTDITKLTEAVDHLMQNAVKFTEKGSITLGFDLVKGDHVRIYVRDTGKGIAQEDQERIFERFVKIDEYIPGTGLGLSVAKAHVLSLHGTMGVESTLGEGSTFWMELPMS